MFGFFFYFHSWFFRVFFTSTHFFMCIFSDDIWNTISLIKSLIQPPHATCHLSVLGTKKIFQKVQVKLTKLCRKLLSLRFQNCGNFYCSFLFFLFEVKYICHLQRITLIEKNAELRKGWTFLSGKRHTYIFSGRTTKIRAPPPQDLRGSNHFLICLKIGNGQNGQKMQNLFCLNLRINIFQYLRKI